MPSYHRVSVSEASVHTAANIEEDSHQATNRSTTHNGFSQTWSECILEKGVALVWVLVAGMVAYTTRFWSVVTYQGNRHETEQLHPVKPLLQLVALCLVTIFLQALYLKCYLPWVKGLTESSAWSVYCPRVVPSMIGMAVVAVVTLIRACWPVWGFLTPLLVGVELLGLLFATHFAPWPC